MAYFQRTSRVKRGGRGGRTGNRGGTIDSLPWDIRRVMMRLEAQESPELKNLRAEMRGNLVEMTQFFIGAEAIRHEKKDVTMAFPDPEVVKMITNGVIKLRDLSASVASLKIPGISSPEELVDQFRGPDSLTGEEPLAERLALTKESNIADIAIRSALGFDQAGPAGWLDKGDINFVKVFMVGYSVTELSTIDEIRRQIKDMLEQSVQGDRTETSNAEDVLQGMLETSPKVWDALLEDATYTGALTQASMAKADTNLRKLYDQLVQQEAGIQNKIAAAAGGAFNQTFNINRLTALSSGLAKLFLTRKEKSLNLAQVIASVEAIARMADPNSIMKALNEIFTDVDYAVIHNDFASIHCSSTILTPSRISDCFCLTTSIPSLPGSITLCTDRVLGVNAIIEVGLLERARRIQVWSSARALLRIMATGFMNFSGKNVSRVTRNFIQVLWAIKAGGSKEILLSGPDMDDMTPIESASGVTGRKPLTDKKSEDEDFTGYEA